MNVSNLEMVCTYFCSHQNLFHWNFDQFPKEAFFDSVAQIHLYTLCICALIGVGQFVPWLYRKYPRCHFALGNVYVMMILLLLGPATILYSWRFEWVEMLSVMIVGACMWWWTKKGIQAILDKKWLLHLRCMQRSYFIVLFLLIEKICMMKVWIALGFAILLIIVEITNIQKKWMKQFFLRD